MVSGSLRINGVMVILVVMLFRDQLVFSFVM